MTKVAKISTPGLVLVVVTAIAVAGVAYVLGTQKSRVSPAFIPQMMFADLKGQLDEIDRLAVRSKDAAFDIVKTARGDWLIPQKDNYPAAVNSVRAALLALSELELVEPKTTRPARYPALGLGAPQDGGRGIEFSVWRGGQELASLVVGDRQQARTSDGRAQFYVRTPAVEQTWMARGRLDVKPLAIDWMTRSVLALSRADIAAFELAPPEGAAYKLFRPSPDETDVALENPPQGRTPQPAYTLNASAFAPVGLLVEDVRRADEVDFSSGTVARVVYTTFGGIVLELELAARDEKYWMKAVAAPMPAPSTAEPAQQLSDETPEKGAEADVFDGEGVSEVEDAGASAAKTENEAAALNRRLAGWAFAIPKYKYDQMTKPLEDLLEPPAE